MKNTLNHVSCKETMKLFGDYWTLRIIDSLRSGEKRFCELQRNLEDLNPVTLTGRLKRLEESGIILRSENTIDKISVTYSLSRLGKEALQIIKALDKFSIKTSALTTQHN